MLANNIKDIRHELIGETHEDAEQKATRKQVVEAIKNHTEGRSRTVEKYLSVMRQFKIIEKARTEEADKDVYFLR